MISDGESLREPRSLNQGQPGWLYLANTAAISGIPVHPAGSATCERVMSENSNASLLSYLLFNHFYQEYKARKP